MSQPVLCDAYKGAWVAMLRASSGLVKAIDARMRGAGVVSIDVYDVLLNLEMAEGGHLKMSELAEAVLLTRGGITKLVDRLERDGLVERQSCPGDRRAIFVALTPKGLAERERAWLVYGVEIGRVLESLTPEEAGQLEGLLRRLGYSGTCPSAENTPPAQGAVTATG